ncbi:flagellin N-terminal helical domain-containing protein [Rheinheimera sp. UJ63]|uniref:flagellin N-terminal helical domain-containing protein n=1 Tax=Rheinheimera sp. UJ63 TaxID=2910157 RepID=UPI001F1E46DB|nr:flagellin [Rheinheimera sp. UJ63]MCF4009075.1 flagellin FliC [Rheinheimera sp. UJ63]
MALFVNTNSSALNAQRQLINSGGALDTAFKRLSSGFRINSAADDAAGLQISNRLTSQINGLDQAARNANDGISLAQVAEGAFDEITNSLQRMRTLAIQAQNGISNADDKAALQKEFSALAAEITRVAQTTEFGGQKLLTGGFSTKVLVGAQAAAADFISVNVSRSGGWSAGATGLQLASVNMATNATGVDSASGALTKIDVALKAVDGKRADLGAVQNRFQATIRNLTNVSENVSSARARIRDTDFAKETAELTRAQILQQTGTTVLAQANQRPQAALSLLQG